jgi:integrase
MPRRRGGPRLVTRKGKSSYFIRFIDADGRQKDRSTGTTDRNEAEEALEEFLKQRRGVDRPRELRKVFIAEVLNDYAEFLRPRPSASERLAYAMTHLLDYWEDRTVDAINKVSIQDYCVKANRKTSTVRRELICLRGAMNHAVSMNRMVPFNRFELPEDSSPRDRWLDKSEAALLLCSARAEYRSKFTLSLFISLALHTAQRMGAILELEWDQIDFRNRVIDFNKPGKVKTKKRRGKMRMSPMVFGHLLRRFRMYGDKSKFVFHQKQAPYNRVSSITKGFRAACVRAELKKVTPHTLRHTAISWAVQRGESRSEVSEYVNLSMETMDAVYAHHDPERLRKLADRM